MPNSNLYQYYQSKGQGLPSIQQRAGDALKAGIQNYSGTAAQNNQLLGYLEGNPTGSNGQTQINASMLGGNTGLNIPSPIPTTNPTQIVAGMSLPQFNAIDVTKSGSYGQATNQLNKQGAGINAAQQRILELMGKQEGKGAREAELQKQFQLQEKQKLQDLASQKIQETQKAYLAEQIAVAGRPIGLERQGGKLDQLRRREAIDLLSQSITLDAATGDVQSAQRGIENALKLEFEPIQARIDTTKQFLAFNMDNFNRAEKQQAQALNIKLDREKADLDYFRDIKKMAYADMLKNGASSGQLSALSSTKSAKDIFALGGANAIAQATPPLANGKPDVVSQLANVIKYAKDVPSSSLAIGVLAGVQKLATANPEGKFVGAAGGGLWSPINLRFGKKRGEFINNRADFGAIEGAVQKWMTGANVGEDQRVFVNSMTPHKNESDFTIRTKLNNLTEYMQSQARAELAGKGIDFAPTLVDYFSNPVANEVQTYNGYTLPTSQTAPTYSGFVLPN